VRDTPRLPDSAAQPVTMPTPIDPEHSRLHGTGHAQDSDDRSGGRSRRRHHAEGRPSHARPPAGPGHLCARQRQQSVQHEEPPGRRVSRRGGLRHPAARPAHVTGRSHRRGHRGVPLRHCAPRPSRERRRRLGRHPSRHRCASDRMLRREHRRSRSVDCGGGAAGRHRCGGVARRSSRSGRRGAWAGQGADAAGRRWPRRACHRAQS
jgi:hypothetical protein